MCVVRDYPGWAGTRKAKPIWILLKQETMSGSGISWAICKSAPRSRQITTPAHQHSVFTGQMPFLPPNQQRQCDMCWKFVICLANNNSSQQRCKSKSKRSFYRFFRCIVYLCHIHLLVFMLSVLMLSVFGHCWLGIRKSIRPLKIEWWGLGVVICLERGADCLHVVQLMQCIPKPHHLLCYLNPDGVLSGAGSPRLSWKRGH